MFAFVFDPSDCDQALPSQLCDQRTLEATEGGRSKRPDPVNHEDGVAVLRLDDVAGLLAHCRLPFETANAAAQVVDVVSLRPDKTFNTAVLLHALKLPW